MALCLRYIHLLISEKQSLWSAWHRQNNLRGSNFWGINESPSKSWIWNSLLKLHPLAAQFVITTVGDGKKTSFWYDKWTPLGSLIDFLGANGPRNLRLPLTSTVADACDANGQRLLAPRSDSEVILHTHLTTLPLPTTSLIENATNWAINGVNYKLFPSAKTWEAIRPRKAPQQWMSSIWFKGSVPKQAFNMWISHLDRLPTKARLASWGIPLSTDCCLCSANLENRDHLLLTCSFAETIWTMVLARLGPVHLRLRSWHELLSWTRSRSKFVPSTMRKLVAQAVIYHIWKQRNNVIHNSTSLSLALVFKLIDREIINTITARRGRRKFNSLMTLWLR